MKHIPADVMETSNAAPTKTPTKMDAREKFIIVAVGEAAEENWTDEDEDSQVDSLKGDSKVHLLDC